MLQYKSILLQKIKFWSTNEALWFPELTEFSTLKEDFVGFFLFFFFFFLNGIQHNEQNGNKYKSPNREKIWES